MQIIKCDKCGKELKENEVFEGAMGYKRSLEEIEQLLKAKEIPITEESLMAMTCTSAVFKKIDMCSECFNKFKEACK